ncbi:MAG: hypothetical protein SWQ30_22040, partial [Thermodesulfobacteriota bacterium]|nr:hypothetical protein [Thermodesulfobacteriota bacterium]
MIKLIGLLGIPLLVLGLIGAVHGHPIADPGGPYTFEFGDDWVLDASASYDTEGPLMNIVYYEWALENDGKPPEWPSNSPITVIQWYQLEQDGVGVLGTHTIGLIVENDWGDQSDWQETTVDVVESL